MHDHEGHRVDKRKIRSVDPAGDPGDEGGEAESEDPIGPCRYPDRFRQVLRIPHADDGFPQSGPVDLAHDQHGDNKKNKHQIVIRRLSRIGLVEHQSEQVRDLDRARARDLVDPQQATKDRLPSVHVEMANDFAKRKSDEEEVGPSQPQGGDSDRKRDEGGDDATQGQGEPEVEVEVLHQGGGRVSTDHHESPLGEGDLSGSMDEPIPQDHDTEQEYDGDVMQVELIVQPHRQPQENNGTEDAEAPSHCG